MMKSAITRSGFDMQALMADFKNEIMDRDIPLTNDMPRCRVLLAEDDFANQMVAIHLLEMLDLEVHAVTSGLDALECCRSGDFDIAVMDLKMHGMDGLEVIRRIRAFERVTRRAPMSIICVTANAFIDQDEVCKVAGASDYLVKPYNIDLFQAKLAALHQQWLHTRTL